MTETQQSPPNIREGQCIARKKSCRKCGHRYPKEERPFWYCPECGEPRRCTNKAKAGFDVCHIHGAAAGAANTKPVHGKLLIHSKLQAAYNRIFLHPDLWDTSEQQAILNVQYETVLNSIGEIESNGQGVDIETISAVLDRLEGMARSIEKGGGYKLLSPIMEIRNHLTPEYREQSLWSRLNQVGEHIRKNAESTKRFLKDSEMMVSAAELIEMMAWLQTIAFRFMPDPQVRREYVLTIREALPTKRQVEAIEAQFTEINQSADELIEPDD
jgi:hypothetical protein